MSTNTFSIDLEDGLVSFLSALDSVSLSITGNMTIEFWTKRESADNSMTVVSKSLATGNQRSYYVQLDTAGDVNVGISNDGTGAGTVEKVYATGITTGTWFHIACVYTAATGAVEVFENTVSVGSQSGFPTAIFDSSADFNIGAINNGSTSFYDGLVDEVRLWNTVRTQPQIAANYQVQLVGNESGLQAYWQLNNELLDMTANNNDLTNSSGVFSTDVPFTGGSLPVLMLLGVG